MTTVEEWKEDFKSFINELQMPRDDYKGIMSYIDEGADLLKEQEPVAPKKQEETRIWTVCGKCSQHLISKWTYCPYCGQAVKWDE